MHEVIPNRLWVGNAVEARDLRGLLDMGVAALVDLAIEELPPNVVRELVYCRIPLIDGASNPPERLRLAVETVASLIRSGTPTFVFCGAGMSRSPSIAAAAMAVIEGADPNVMLQRIVAGFPHDVSPALWQEVTAASVSVSTKARILETLYCASESGGQLIGVTCAQFDCEPPFITGIAFQFERMTAAFHAVSNDDTLNSSMGDLIVESDESLINVSRSLPWEKCLGRCLRWGWRMTNQRGYTDGVRLEFGLPDEPSTIIELVVCASAIKVFKAKLENP